MMAKEHTAPTRLRRVKTAHAGIVLSFSSPEYAELIEELNYLLRLVRNGEITGIAMTALFNDGTTKEKVMGVARSDLHRAVYGVCRLKDCLVWPDNKGVTR